MLSAPAVQHQPRNDCGELVAGEGELVHRIGVRSHGLHVPAPELEREREAAPLLPSTMVVLSFGF
jgi:hypothetical protein